ncbi:MAG: potassium channel family protein [Promethearchaeota archaeon]
MSKNIAKTEGSYKKQQIFEILSFPKLKSPLAFVFGILFIFASLSNGISAILETEQALQDQFWTSYMVLTVIAGIIFSIEYVLRIWTSSINPQFDDFKLKVKSMELKIKRKEIAYAISFMGIIDLVCVISFILYLNALIYTDLVELTRVLRLISFLKFIRYATSFEIIWAVIKRKKEELLITIMLSLLLMFFGSIFIYIAEHDAQPEVITNLFSSMWFTAVNLFTIGYGEITPITPMGKVVSAIISIMGITLFLLPASVIGSGFIEELEERHPPLDTCPNCKKKIRKEEFLVDLYKKRRGRKSAIITKVIEEEKARREPIPTPERKVYTLMRFPFPRTIGQVIVFLFFATFITFNVLAIMVETNLTLSQEVRPILNLVYILSLIIFSIEYIIRVWSCVAEGEQYEELAKAARLKYIQTPMAIADLIVIIALILLLIPPVLVPLGRLYFLVPMMCVVFKIGHYIDVFKIAGLIFRDITKEFLGAIFICIMFLIFASTAIYYVESGAQPDKFSSIPATLWFGIATFTTTGFGDIYPITTQGRMLTVAFAFLGVALFTLPAGILGSSFFSGMQEYRLFKICPKCGFIISRPTLDRQKKL